MRTLTIIDNEMMWCTPDNAYVDSKGIQKLLEAFDSWLKDEKINGRPFSEWIFETSLHAGIEPLMTLAMLQKESSLIQKYHNRPPDKLLDWCLGFGCPESGGRNENYRGFTKQIDSMLEAFSEKYPKWPQVINFKTTPINIYGAQGGEKVLAGNLETAMHLLYNPRLSDGVELLKTVWDRMYSKAEELGIIND